MEDNRPKIVRFIAPFGALKLPQFRVVNKDGSNLYVSQADLIHLLSEGLKVQYEVIPAFDVAIGAKQPNGNWTGILGMIFRSEADLAMGDLFVTEERYEAVNFTFPHVLSRITFMTDEPQPLSKNLAIFYPFTYEIWISLLLFFAVVSMLFYVWMKRKKSLQSVLLITLGSVFEQSLNFEKKTAAFRMLALAWILGVMILSYSYKAVLLSFLLFPTLSGIRDISDLSEASTDRSFRCITVKGSYLIRNLMESNSSTLRNIGECLNRNDVESGDVLEAFQNSGSKRALIASMSGMTAFATDYFISEDSFFMTLSGIPFSRTFCCPNRLNAIIHQMLASGLLDKLNSDYYFRNRLQWKFFESNISETVMTVHLDDISGAFYILMSGWLLSLIVFFKEILIAKLSSQ